LNYKSDKYYTTRCVLYQIPFSTTHVVYYGMLTIHESISPFPVTIHYFRMMCDKDILQLYFEDLNYATYSLKKTATIIQAQ